MVDPDKYKNTFRVSSTRLKDWDYAGNGTYFVTICTKNKVKWFGEIEDDEVKLSEIGKIARQCWEDIPKHFPFVYVDEFVFMPNHVHGILTFDVEEESGRGFKNTTGTGVIVETQNFASLHPENKFGPQSRNLGSVIRGFKIGVTTQAKLISPSFTWQPRFYEHIIHTDKDLTNPPLYHL